MARRIAWLVLAVVLVCSSALPALAQAAREARLIVTVVDQTGAVIPNAAVSVIGLEEATKKATIAPTKSSDKGLATFEHLVPGRYSVQGEFPGFEMGLLRDIRLKAGDNKHLVVLPLAKFTEDVTVGRDKQTAGSDRAGAFGTALTREQMEALSEDPDELARQLQSLAGPDATIRVDSFEGQQLPPKAQIKAIHITRDAFAAENHSAYGLFIDIITQPGMGPLRGQGRFSFYDSALDGRNPTIPQRGPAQNRGVSLGLGGTLIKDKSSFSLSVSGTNSYRTPNLTQSANNSAVQALNLDLRTTYNYLSIYGNLDYAITKDQTLRLSVNRWSMTNGNQGVGTLDQPERAYSSDYTSYNVRVQEAGPLGRRFFINTRFSLNWSNSVSRSATEELTTMVSGGYNYGGAQVKGGRYTRTFSLMSDLDYVRGRHSLRGGVQFDGGRYRSDSTSSYLGTYVFNGDPIQYGLSETVYPTSYRRSIGDPNIAYWNLQAGLYLQDDIRISKGLTLTPGVRFEAQTHLDAPPTVGPRFGITWSPFKGGKTTLRASMGYFYDWLSSGTYEQTIRMDGIHQRDVMLSGDHAGDISYPDPGPLTAVPSGRYLLGPDVRMARTFRMSAGIDEQVTKMLRVGANYLDTRGNGLLAGVNLNAPLALNVYPDPAWKNVIEANPIGRSRTQSVSVNTQLNFSPTSAGSTFGGSGLSGKNEPRFRWRRGLSVYANYTLGRSQNNTDGAFTVSPTGTIDTEWAYSSGDVRHRVSTALYTGVLKNLTASFYVSANSGRPYNFTVPADVNFDGIYNDRPAGVGRNVFRSGWQYYSSAYLTYTIGVGKRTVALPPGITLTSSGGGLSLNTFAQPDAPRYRLTFNLSLDNLTNHQNYVSYVGVQGSPFFMKPTSLEGVRTINFAVGISF
jgi:hypothetical protein